jgi:hypothetical protein
MMGLMRGEQAGYREMGRKTTRRTHRREHAVALVMPGRGASLEG